MALQAAKQKFASQANPKLLKKMRQIASQEGRQFQAVLHEAMESYVERKQRQKQSKAQIAKEVDALLRKRKGKMRPEVLKAFRESLIESDELYRLLAAYDSLPQR